MTRRVRALLLGGGLILGLGNAPLFIPSQAHATLVDPPPPLEYEEPVDAWATPEEEQESPFHRRRLRGTHRRQLAEGLVATVVIQLTNVFAAQDWGEDHEQHRKAVNQFVAFAEAVEIASSQPEIDGPLDTEAEQDAFLLSLNNQGFGLAHFALSPLIDELGNDVTGFFGDTPDEIQLFEWLPEGDRIRLLVPAPETRQLRLLADTFTTLLRDLTDLSAEANVQALQDAAERWENFLNRGYSQMPWEALINGALIDAPGFPKLGPPSNQWVILHPALGLEFNTPFNDMRVKPVMHIELLGHIFYTGKQQSNYWGFSASVSLREDLPPGLGGMLHLRRHWALGAAWHDDPNDPFVFMSFDLFRFARDEPAKYKKKYGEVVDLISGSP